MRAIAKFWWIGAVISGAGTIIAALLIRFLSFVASIENPNILILLTGILGFLLAICCIMAVVLSFEFTLILILVRFYKHFFTDEGYLTFTLPVKRSSLLLSKVVSAFIWIWAHLAIIGTSILLFCMLAIPPKEGGSFLNFFLLREISRVLASAWSSIGPWVIVYALEALLLSVVYSLFSVLLIYFCITFGSMIVKRAKLILSIGLYYAFSSILAVSGQFGIILFGSFVSDGMHTLMKDASQNRVCAAYTFLILSVISALGVISAVLYSLTQTILHRRLNLA